MKKNDEQSPSHSIQSKADKEKQTILRDKEVVRTQNHPVSAKKRVTITVEDHKGLEQVYGRYLDNEEALKVD